jgi:hypothetical protein
VSSVQNHHSGPARRFGVPHARSLGVGVLGLVVVVLLLVPSFGLNEAVPLLSGAASDLQTALGPVAATLLRGPIAGTSSSTFWAVIAQTHNSTAITSEPSVGGFLNATPITWFEYTQETDQCNITSNALYSDAGARVGGCGFDIQSLKTWCLSRGPDCHAILLLPGENNNSAEDANMANYIVHTLHFQPSYFAIGNEPMLWTHYGISWSHWKLSDHSTPTPLAYAFDVKAAIHAVRAVDPAAKFIGIEADCQCAGKWFSTDVQVNGPQISAIAYHSYPSTTKKTVVTPAQLFSALTSPLNITTSYAQVRADIAGQCARCGSLPIFLAEYNSGPGWGPSNLAGTWSGSVFLAASVVQAIRANVTMFSTFNLQSAGAGVTWSMINAQGSTGYEGRLYDQLLSHLAMGEYRNESVATRVGNVWAVVTVGPAGHHTLLVVNANASSAIDLNLNNALWIGPASAPTTYQWSPGMYSPSVSSGRLPASYTIPAQGILMIDYTN